MKQTAIIVLLSAAFSIASCNKNADISGKYIKASGDYRYNIIVFEKIKGSKFNISCFEGDIIKFKTTGELNEKEIDMGWLSKLTFKDDFRQFYLHSGEGSVFIKEDKGRK